MKITVNEQPQQFYLAFKEWTPAVGHEIQVGKYRFCAIVIGNKINVSEVTTGARVLNIPFDFATLLITGTKEDTIKYFYSIGESIKRAIEKSNDVDVMISEMQEIAYERLGEMPEIKNVDVEV
ncbi:hypothetical protein PD280_06240 [Virgibacillus salarius]|uniref:hypothetical protein n=1 Tax=Virgibacillus salarius TaxID=447199 RepID=UPI002491B3D8|nr:hypothetical protein [Virgibacillus salarius]WBX81317.1 hypothetical protein PD280_06240 [Virgibacillus salarius]